MQKKSSASMLIPRTFSPREVARALGMSEASIKRWCDQGEFQVVKTRGGHRRIPLGSVLAHLRRSKLPLEQAEVLGAHNIAQHAQKGPAQEVTPLSKDGVQPGSVPLETTPVDPHAEAHIGRLPLDPEPPEQLDKARVILFVENDEACVDQDGAVSASHGDCVGVAADATVSLIHGDVMLRAEQVRRHKTRDT